MNKAQSIELSVPANWPEGGTALHYTTSSDRSLQPMIIYSAQSQNKRPLLIGLHTWGGSYNQAGGAAYARWCIQQDWHFAHPHFRGPNNTPQSCGSDQVVQDIIDAVEYMKASGNVDTNRIYLVGASGGGYAALLLAGRHPDVWAGVSAWVPISDLGLWWEQTKDSGTYAYAQNIERVIGGQPDQNESTARECMKRSALTYLDQSSSVNLDINAGVTDGHAGGPVPFTHSLYAFNNVAADRDRIPPALIESFFLTGNLPKGLAEADSDTLYGSHQPVFRKISNRARVTIFNGGHQILHSAALNWLNQQRKNQPASWNILKKYDVETTPQESKSER